MRHHPQGGCRGRALPMAAAEGRAAVTQGRAAGRGLDDPWLTSCGLHLWEAWRRLPERRARAAGRGPVHWQAVQGVARAARPALTDGPAVGLQRGQVRRQLLRGLQAPVSLPLDVRGGPAHQRALGAVPADGARRVPHGRRARRARAVRTDAQGVHTGQVGAGRRDQARHCANNVA